MVYSMQKQIKDLLQIRKSLAIMNSKRETDVKMTNEGSAIDWAYSPEDAAILAATEIK